jgi:dihydrofolate reductase
MAPIFLLSRSCVKYIYEASLRCAFMRSATGHANIMPRQARVSEHNAPMHEPFASYVNGTQKYVASTTLGSVGQWPNSTLIKGPVTDFLAELRQQDGGTIGTAGSPSLVRSLIEHGLLDELTLMISPVVAGGGRKRLLGDDAALTASRWPLCAGRGGG